MPAKVSLHKANARTLTAMATKQQDLVNSLLPEDSWSDMLLKRPAGLGNVEHVVRIAIAATAAWFLATYLSQSTLGIFAPITALMVVQTSPWSALGVSLQRILGASLGVLLASLYINVAGLSWWTFLIGVLVSLLIARLLPFSIGGQLQIPIAVVFVLALGPGSIEQDLWRVLDVFLGGGVALLAVVLWPNRPPVGKLQSALAAYRDAQLELLRAMKTEIAITALITGEHHDFLAQARQLRDRADESRAALIDVAEATHLNLRGRHARGQLLDFAVSVQRLSNIALQIRGVAGLANALYDRNLHPALDEETFGSFLDQLANNLESAAGTGDIVLTGVAGRLNDQAFADSLRAAATGVVESHGGAGSVLESVSLIGRLDFTRLQIQGYAQGMPVDLGNT